MRRFLLATAQLAALFLSPALAYPEITPRSGQVCKGEFSQTPTGKLQITVWVDGPHARVEAQWFHKKDGTPDGGPFVSESEVVVNEQSYARLPTTLPSRYPVYAGFDEEGNLAKVTLKQMTRPC